MPDTAKIGLDERAQLRSVDAVRDPHDGQLRLVYIVPQQLETCP